MTSSSHPMFDLDKKVTLLARANWESLDWNHQQATERQAGAPLSRTPWRIRAVDQGHGQHREGEECMLMLAEVRGNVRPRGVYLVQRSAPGARQLGNAYLGKPEQPSGQQGHAEQCALDTQGESSGSLAATAAAAACKQFKYSITVQP